jgi:hypothetical protein
MALWQQECPRCGYVNVTVNTPLSGADVVVASPEFAAVRANSDEPALVNRFRRYALLIADDPIKSGWTMLHAAWVYDDLENQALAKRCREECVDLWSTQRFDKNESSVRIRTVMVDVLRRAECFDEAIMCLDLAMEGDATLIMEKVLAFQRRLIAVFDVDAYTVEQAVAVYRSPDILRSRRFAGFKLR